MYIYMCIYKCVCKSPFLRIRILTGDLDDTHPYVSYISFYTHRC